ncbi:hypothetical protein [Streptomyces sp. NPDC018693]|uniref:hypothetical protein n=1 Tax=unclassified Streptomyces TaxID=2593676 RepID=UPI003792D6C8
MQRTTTTATLLVTVAVSALSGCVTVQQRPPVPGPPPVAPSQLPVPRPDGRAETQVVQAPVQEALEMVRPAATPQAAVPARRPDTEPQRSVPLGERPERSESPRKAQAQPHPRPTHPSPRRTAHPGGGTLDLSKGTSNEMAREVSQGVQKEVRKNTDVCALGKKYGGWRADSPEAVICRQTYGR